MKTHHEGVYGNACDMSEVADESVELVVTSPPYPMVEMWDDAFATQSKRASSALVAEDGDDAFEAMHRVLDDVWAEVERVLVDGGIACVNIGDATRSIGGEFSLYPNHARIITAFQRLGFNALPDILWRKPTNSLTKFMGSGMRPPNAYITLEHEYILVFRKGGLRQPTPETRDESAYFWEERNSWFSDVWMDVPGIRQATGDNANRDRSGAFPLAIPYRLINMFSVRGETVLDPFLGTGTTVLAAMCAGRDSIGYEIDKTILDALSESVSGVSELSQSVADSRLQAHREFVAESDRKFKYTSDVYGFLVTTSGEVGLELLEISNVEESGSSFTLEHEVAQ